MFVAIYRLAFILSLASATGDSWAQTMNRCPTSNGGYQWSDRPCVGVPSKLGALGNTSGAVNGYSNSSNYYGRTIEKAADFLPLLSPVCAQLNDAMRTGASRGVSSATLADVRAEYRNKCSEEEQEARQKLSQQTRDQREQRQRQKRNEQIEATQAANAEAQCQELLRILHNKRQRYETLTPGQRDDLKLFDAQYKQRCTRS